MNDEVTMVRHNLDHIPHFSLPSGYSLRWYQAGDEEIWQEIQSRADKYNDITQDTFGKAFGFEQQLRNRQCYIIDQNRIPVGTATAWYRDDDRGVRSGRVHWVAIVPESQGRGLAKPLMATVCERLALLGHIHAFLTTSTARIPAINLYLKFGFVPDIGDHSKLEAWHGIRDQVKYPLNLRT